MVLPVRHRVPQRFCLLLYSASGRSYPPVQLPFYTLHATVHLKIIRKKFQCHLHILTVVHMLICVNMILSDRKCFQIICLFRKSDFSSLIWYIKWFFYSIQLNILWLRPGWSSCLCTINAQTEFAQARYFPSASFI